MNLAVEGFSVVILKDSLDDPNARVPDNLMMAERIDMISSLDISVFLVISLFTVDENDIYAHPNLFYFLLLISLKYRKIRTDLVQLTHLLYHNASAIETHICMQNKKRSADVERKIPCICTSIILGFLDLQLAG